MKKRILICILTIAAMMALFCVSAFAAETVSVQVGGRVDYQLAEQVFEQLNEYRTANGLKPLVLDQGLTNAAIHRAVEASVCFHPNHLRPNGENFYTVIEQVYGRTGNAAENLAAGQTSSAQVMSEWKKSSGHNKNMLKTNVTHVGVGCVYVDGVYYWVQLFSSVGADNTSDYSGKTNAAFLIQVDAQKDKLSSSQYSKTLELTCGGESTPYEFTLNYKLNITDNQVTASLIPTVITADSPSYTVKSDSGSDIATISLNRNGESGMTITPLAPGSATLELPIYTGQSDPYLLTLVITEAHVHTYSSTVHEPTCVEHGWTFFQCTGCGHYYTERIEATGEHIFGEWTYHPEPTLYSSGKRYKSCIFYDDCHQQIWEDVPPLTNPFVDVASGAFYTEPVVWAVFHEITTGMDATHFAPTRDCTRGQIVTFLWRAKGEPQPESTDNPFVDVKEDSYCYTAVLWAVENGITKGMDETHFAPNATCTRGLAVTFLWRSEGEPESDSWNIFADVFPDSFYYDAVLWAVDENITKGTDNLHFSPKLNCTRGQIVTFLYRTMN